MKRRLWMVVSNLANPHLHLPIPTVARIAKHAGVDFECYLEAERDGTLFARTGSTVLGGSHHQQFSYLNAAFDVEYIIFGEASLLLSSIQVFNAPILVQTSSVLELYQALLPRVEELADVIVAPGSLLEIEGRVLEIGPYLFPEIFYRKAVEMPASLIEEQPAFIKAIGVQPASHLFLSAAERQQLIHRFPEVVEVDSIQSQDTCGTITLRIAERWNHMPKGLACGDPPAILSQLPSLCRDARIAVYAEKIPLPRAQVFAAPYTEEKSAIVEDVIRLAHDLRNRVMVGRQTGGGDLFGRCQLELPGQAVAAASAVTSRGLPRSRELYAVAATPITSFQTRNRRWRSARYSRTATLVREEWRVAAMRLPRPLTHGGLVRCQPRRTERTSAGTAHNTRVTVGAVRRGNSSPGAAGNQNLLQTLELRNV